MKNKIKLCDWLLPNGNFCDKTALSNSDYCYIHKPLAYINYDRDELELEEQSNFYDDNDVFSEEYWKEETFATWEDKFKDNYESLEDAWEEELKYSFERWKNNEYTPRNNYKTISYAKKSLKEGEYVIHKNIEYMHYIIARSDSGDYFAVWVSLEGKEDIHRVMKSIIKNLPSGVKLHGKGNYHTSKPLKNYENAEDMFFRGFETSHRILQRIDNAKNDKWFPPNLRKLAVEGRLDEVPERSRKHLKKWLLDGAPGWNSYKTIKDGSSEKTKIKTYTRW